MTLAIPWHKMTAREQLVWTATYAAHAEGCVDAIRQANQVVLKLHELNVDDKKFQGPEYYAAQHGAGLTFEEFRAWYPVALKIAKRGLLRPEEVDVAACQRAYDIYCQCTTDFY